MKFFQRLNICKRCGVAFEPTYKNYDLCAVHYIEEQQEKKEEEKFQNWISVNRGRLKAEMKADFDKKAENASNDIKSAMNQQLAGLYGQNNLYENNRMNHLSGLNPYQNGKY